MSIKEDIQKTREKFAKYLAEKELVMIAVIEIYFLAMY